MSKSNSILRQQDVEIKGKVRLRTSFGDGTVDILEKLSRKEQSIEMKIIEAKEKYQKIINETEKKKIKILEDAKEEAELIEKKAYTTGYNQGLKNGYEDGYKEAYEDNIHKAMEESQKIKDETYSTLLDVRNQTATYIKNNKKKILEIAVAIAEKVLREKFEDLTAMDNMILDIIQEHHFKGDIIIKVNKLYANELQRRVNEMISNLNISQRIFVIDDAAIDKGNAEIETKTGKLILGMDIVLDKVREELL